MRLLLLGVAAVALSGCSWLGLGKSSHHGKTSSAQGYYSKGQNQCCVNGRHLSRWNIEGAVGPEFIVGGDILTGSEIHNRELVSADDLSMKDAYDPGLRYELGGSYALNPNRKITLMGTYAKAKGERVDLGTIGDDVVSGTLSDYKRMGVEAGLRQYFTPKSAPLVRSVRPYVEGRLGASKIDDIQITNAQLNNTAAFGNGTLPLYEGGWVPTAAGLVGVEAPVFNRATLGLETGIRYTGALKSDGTVLNGQSNFAGINNGSESWTVPVMLRGRYRF